MPLEIKEIIVRGTVVPDTSDGKSATDSSNTKMTAIERQIIIQECIEQVLEIMKRKNES